MDNQATGRGTQARNPLSSEEAWELAADGYTAEFLPMMEHFAGNALRLASLPATPRVLDVATGPGTLALLAADQGANVSAIDFSPAMVTNLLHRAEEQGLTIADVRVCDGQDLPYGDETFDGAFSLLGLMFFPDRRAGFRELLRVLRPQRRAVVSSIKPFKGAFAMVLNAIGEVLPDLPGAGGKAPLSDPEEFRREMTAAGFNGVEVHTVIYSYVKPSLSEYWDALQRSAAPVALLGPKLGEEGWAQVAAGVFDQLQKSIGDGPVEDLCAVNLGLGIK